MITIPSELKPTLNTLIHYYRRHNEDPSFQAKNFVLNKDGIEICDVSTLSKLENNKIQCMDDIYFELLKNLNYSFIYDEIANNLIQNTNHALLKHAEINDVPKILSLLTKIIETLSTYKNCIVYKEYLEIYEILYDYYDNQKFNKEQIDKYIELYDLIEEELRPIFISIAYHYYSRVNIDELKIQTIINKTNSLNNENIIKMYLLTIHYATNNKTSKLLEFAKNGVDLCKKRNNKYYLVRFYNALSFAYRFNNLNKSIYYLTLCISNFDKTNDNYSTLAAFYHNMAHLCYDQKKYYTILYLYKKHLYNDIQFLNVFFYLLIHIIQITTNDNEEICRIINIVEPEMQYSLFDTAVLNLFKSIHIYHDEERLIVSIKNIIDFEEYFSNESIMKEVVIETVKTACKSINNYNLYKQFIENFQ